MKNGMTIEGYYPTWNSKYNTNCYAFALGLDVPQDNICHHAYYPGNIAHNVLATTTNDYGITKEEIEEQLFFDFRALRMTYQAFQDEDKYQYLKVLDHPDFYWDILFFLNPSIPDYHFARVTNDGKLYHKQGWQLNPRETYIKEIESTGYEFVKRYRVCLKHLR